MTDTIPFLYQQYLQCKGIVTDSRNAVEGKIFFALKGPNFNGNLFAAQALSKGAALAVVDDAQYAQGDRYVLVDDVLTALQQLANHHRRQLNIPIIGITGSNGKTTTKELVRAVLSARYKTVATTGNLNNHIGVPATLLAIGADTEIAVVEMGANHVGDIAALCRIAMPTHGLITSIGHVHIEGFGSFEGVIKGKSELYDYLEQHGGQIFANTCDEVLNHIKDKYTAPRCYPGAQDFYHCTFVGEQPTVVYKSEEGQVVISHLLGKHHFNNIAAALCVGKYFDVDATKANEAIAAYVPNNNRSQLIRKGSNTILLDAYNASLESMTGAIDALNKLSATHRVLILGDMKELGHESEEAHQALGRLTTQATYHKVLLCGPCMIAAKETNPDALYFPDKAALVHYLEQQTFRHTAFLIKGSNSLQMQSLVDVLREETPR